jgi:hypothetical protein
MRDVLTVDAASTIMLLMATEAAYPRMPLIHVFLDNARYHHAKLVQAWLARPDCRIRLHFVPAYCPPETICLITLAVERNVEPFLRRSSISFWRRERHSAIPHTSLLRSKNNGNIRAAIVSYLDAGAFKPIVFRKFNFQTQGR